VECRIAPRVALPSPLLGDKRAPVREGGAQGEGLNAMKDIYAQAKLQDNILWNFVYGQTCTMIKVVALINDLHGTHSCKCRIRIT